MEIHSNYFMEQFEYIREAQCKKIHRKNLSKLFPKEKIEFGIHFENTRGRDHKNVSYVEQRQDLVSRNT